MLDRGTNHSKVGDVELVELGWGFHVDCRNFRPPRARKDNALLDLGGRESNPTSTSLAGCVSITPSPRQDSESGSGSCQIASDVLRSRPKVPIVDLGYGCRPTCHSIVKRLSRVGRSPPDVKPLAESGESSSPCGCE